MYICVHHTKDQIKEYVTNAFFDGKKTFKN